MQRRQLAVHLALAAALAVGAAGCGDDAPTCTFGDPSQPIELELVYRTEAGTIATVTENMELPLIQPPQGGKILLVSARLTNLRGCTAQITASLRDECTNRIIALEQRPINLREASDGWAEPDVPMEISDFANVPACPSAAAERDIEGEPYLLKVRMTDTDERTAERELTVVPVCANDGERIACECECDGNYQLGEPCVPEPDAGAPPGQCPGDLDAGVPDAGSSDANTPLDASTNLDAGP